MQKHDEAMNQHNLEGITALFAPDSKTVILGTGPGERYQGREEIKTAYTEMFKDFDRFCRKVYDVYHILKRLSEKNTTHCG